MARVKHIVGWISVVLLVVTLASIWILTEQNVEGRAAGVRPDAAQESQAGDAVEGADSTTATVHPDPLAPVRLWMGANIRRVAHTVEFFSVGLFASATVACLGERLPCARFRYVLAALFCAVCSVGDQVHKIFVPGRHFDMIDLGFDAAGYVTAMLLVLLVSAWVHHVTRPIGAHARR